MQGGADGARDLQPGAVPRLHRVERVVRVLQDLRRGISGEKQLTRTSDAVRKVYRNSLNPRSVPQVNPTQMIPKITCLKSGPREGLPADRHLPQLEVRRGAEGAEVRHNFR